MSALSEPQASSGERLSSNTSGAYCAPAFVYLQKETHHLIILGSIPLFLVIISGNPISHNVLIPWVPQGGRPDFFQGPAKFYESS